MLRTPAPYRWVFFNRDDVNVFFSQRVKALFPPGFEPGTFRVLGERDNHYTTETSDRKVSPKMNF